MKINYNMPAYVANGKLLQNENALTASLEKLSSGFKINHAADDPAGMAMSSKMRAQIKGLNQASQNSSDGISVIETAEGALQEVTSILQRMRELAVQSGNDTYVDEDKEAMQDEIAALKEEIDRISTDTEFNKKTLLDGSLNSRVYANTRDVSLVDVSSAVDNTNYKIKVTATSEHAVQTFGVTGTTAPETKDGQPAWSGKDLNKMELSINGVPVRFEEKDLLHEVVNPVTGEKEAAPVLYTASEMYNVLRDAAEKAEVHLFATDGSTPSTEDIYKYPESQGYGSPNIAKNFDFGMTLVGISRDTGSNEVVNIRWSDSVAAKEILGLEDPNNNNNLMSSGKDVQVKLGTPYSTQATVLTKGNKVEISDLEGFQMSFDVSEKTLIDEAEDPTDPTKKVYTTKTDFDLNLQVTNIGNLYLQVGANQYQTIDVDIPCTDCRSLRIDKVDVTTVFGTDKALMALDDALSKVSSIRSNLGAAENRLEATVRSLESTDENMNTALSRIEDVDMAKEMSTYTQMNVLVQAATSVLAQANDLPEQTLQLIQ
ncbi:MAG: flagellin [Lachnospiraceae bacterium]|jgi:flagellin|nr:flagellin [Lachnospiraceae bacterium]